jgi:hypothetical protein
VTSTIFESLALRTRLPWNWLVATLGLVLLGSAIGAAYLDGVLAQLLSSDVWRALFAYPALVVYMLAIISPMQRVGNDAQAAMRTLVSMEDDEFERLVTKAFTLTVKGQWIAFGAGAALGFLSTWAWVAREGVSWLGVYAGLVSCLTGGLLGFSIYSALSAARSMAAFHSHPLKVDIFDVRPFQQISRQSLTSALAFFGGGAISLFFSSWQRDSIGSGTAVFYGIIVLAAALAFFLPTSQTHRVLAAAKGEELIRVQQSIVAAYRSLEQLPPESKDLGLLPTKLNLWKEYEGRVKAAKTWPYDLGMLRTFLLSVLTPVGISFAQRLI